jgi:hypothetical protein
MPPKEAATMTHSHDKFRELVLYVARETQDDPRCGRTKLNKILFYSDFLAYRSLGEPISGQRYQKLEHGPAPRGLLPAVEDMQADGACAWQERDHFGFALRKLIPLREPDLSVFSGPEVDLVRQVISELWELNATEVSDLSHRFVGWQVTAYGEDIPYETVFVEQPRLLSDEETRWAHDAIDAFEKSDASPRPFDF